MPPPFERNTNAQGFPENRGAAKEGGSVAGNARKGLEKKSGRKVSTHQNFKEIPEKILRIEDGEDAPDSHK